MPRRKKRTCIFDSIIDVEAGYPNKKFFPTYNGKETRHADLLNRIEMLDEGEGMVVVVPKDRKTKSVRDEFYMLLNKSGLRPKKGFKYSIRGYFCWEDKVDKVLLTIIPTRKIRRGPNKKPKHVIINEFARTEDQIVLDKIQAVRDLKRHQANMKKIHIKRLAEDDVYRQKLEDRVAARKVRRLEREALRKISKAATGERAKIRMAKLKATREEAQGIKSAELRAKEIRIIRRREASSKRCKERYAKAKKERGYDPST